MGLKFLGSLLITPLTPQALDSVAAIAAAGKGKPFNAIVIQQRRGNAGFVFVGDSAMTGEATLSYIIPPASATTAPFLEIEYGGGGSNPVGIEGIKVDGSAGETVQVYGKEA